MSTVIMTVILTIVVAVVLLGAAVLLWTLLTQTRRRGGGGHNPRFCGRAAAVDASAPLTNGTNGISQPINQANKNNLHI